MFRRRKNSFLIQKTRHAYPRTRLACGLVSSVLVHIGIVLLPWQLVVKMPIDLFPPPDPQLALIELSMEDTAPPPVTTEQLASIDIQQIQAFHTAVDDRTAALEQTILTAFGQQIEAAAERQQRLTNLEAAQSNLSTQVAELTTERAELSVQLAAERERAAALERQLQAQRQAKEAEISGVKGAYDRLVTALKGEISQKEIALHQAKEKLVVTILDRVLFPSGQATLTPEGRSIIKKVGSILANVTDRRIHIEGHTDNVPIGPALSVQFPTNWELSTARATEVVKYLISEVKLSPQLLSAVGRADTAPVTGNDSEEGRKQNRRIEIILLPPEGALHNVASS
jgi:chemotaxis protein MotB